MSEPNKVPNAGNTIGIAGIDLTNFIPGPFGGLLSGLIIENAKGVVHGLEVKTLNRIWAPRIPIIAHSMLSEGWTTNNVAKTKHRTAQANPNNSPNNTIPEIVRDAQWRLWRKIWAFPEGGVIADQFRDRHEKAVLAVVSPLLAQHNIIEIIDEATLDLVVATVAEAEVQVTF